MIVREVVSAARRLDAALDAGRVLSAADRTGITRAVTIAKAVQD